MKFLKNSQRIGTRIAMKTPSTEALVKAHQGGA